MAVGGVMLVLDVVYVFSVATTVGACSAAPCGRRTEAHGVVGPCATHEGWRYLDSLDTYDVVYDDFPGIFIMLIDKDNKGIVDLSRTGDHDDRWIRHACE